MLFALGFLSSFFFPAVLASSSVSLRGLVPGVVGFLSAVLLPRFLLLVESLVDFYFDVLFEVFLVGNLQCYLVFFSSVCVLHQLRLGCFVPALVFRTCCLLRHLFFLDRSFLVRLLLFSSLLVLDKLDFVVLRSVLTFLHVLGRVFLVRFLNIPSFPRPYCRGIRILSPPETR